MRAAEVRIVRIIPLYATGSEKPALAEVEKKKAPGGAILFIRAGRQREPWISPALIAIRHLRLDALPVGFQPAELFSGV